MGVSMASERPHVVAPQGDRLPSPNPQGVSMASERPHVVAPLSPTRKSRPLASTPRFQWPLNGHTSLRLYFTGAVKKALYEVSMASERPHVVAPKGRKDPCTTTTSCFNGLCTATRRCAESKVKVATYTGKMFQWPLNGHTSLRQGRGS